MFTPFVQIMMSKCAWREPKWKNFIECEIQVLKTEVAVNAKGSELRTTVDIKKKWSDIKVIG